MKTLPSFTKSLEFLRESNAIENEYSEEALADASFAWGYLMGFKLGGEFKTPKEIILKVHQLLSIRIMPAIAGKLRDCAVYIGGREAPPSYAVPVLLDEWIKKHWKAKTALAIKKAHIAFEHIHPFVDGNGRTGRLIMNYQRVRAGLPLLIIHTGEEQHEYYDWFLKE